ncbi:MAG: LysR family transcriptional regulator [Deltaproteobacteria bacterium]|nr:LysR family transcriptional regulator [Deltaproteobacteria bacterium]
MDLRRLQVFAKVYEKRSFSRAAEEVYLSQPTVSGHIKSLEEELGVQLFDRLGREILPTKAAELLYVHARDILMRVEDAQHSVDAFLGRLRGDLVVGGSTTPGQYVLPGFIGRFRMLHPEVRVTLHIGDTRQIVEAVLSGELEAGVVGAVVEEERLAYSPLMEDDVSLAGWPGHPFGDSLDAADLKRVPMVLREPGSGTRMSLLKTLKKAGVEATDMNIVAQMGSTMAVLNSVRAQVGLGFLSHRAMLVELEANKVVEVGLNGIVLKRQFYLVTRKKRTHSPASQAFMSLCMAGLEEE